ncbi:hypothetical protein Moror_8182, partial [Moniliophthora roreri MCA 2997]
SSIVFGIAIARPPGPLHCSDVDADEPLALYQFPIILIQTTMLELGNPSEHGFLLLQGSDCQGKKTLRTSNRHISAAYISYGITEPQNDSINTMQDPKVTRILKRQLSPKHHRPNYSFSNQRAPFYPEDIAVSYPLHLPNAPQLPYVSLGAHPLPLRPYCLIGEQ